MARCPPSPRTTHIVDGHQAHQHSRRQHPAQAHVGQRHQVLAGCPCLRERCRDHACHQQHQRQQRPADDGQQQRRPSGQRRQHAQPEPQPLHPRRRRPRQVQGKAPMHPTQEGQDHRTVGHQRQQGPVRQRRVGTERTKAASQRRATARQGPAGWRTSAGGGSSAASAAGWARWLIGRGRCAQRHLAPGAARPAHSRREPLQ